MSKVINQQFTILSTHHNRHMLTDMRFNADEKKKPLIIFCHGFKGFKDWGHFNLIANAFVERGYAFLKFNFSHNGTTVEHPVDFVDLEAFGNNNITIELNDIGDIIDAVLSEESPAPDASIDEDNIFIIGHSRGGGVAMLKAGEEKRIKAVSAWAPVDDFKKRYTSDQLEHWKKEGVIYIQNSRTGQEMPLYYQQVEDFEKNPQRLNIPEVLSIIKKPVLAIHGTSDETLDFKNTEEMEKINEHIEVHIIENANHTFGGSHPWQDTGLPEHTQYVIELTDQFFKSAMT